MSACSVRAQATFAPFESLHILDILNNLAPTVTVTKDGNPICKASMEMPAKSLISGRQEVRVCADVGLALNLVVYSGPASMLFMTLASLIGKAAVKLEVMIEGGDDDDDDKDKNKSHRHQEVAFNPQMKCNILKFRCTWIYTANFPC